MEKPVTRRGGGFSLFSPVLWCKYLSLYGWMLKTRCGTCVRSFVPGMGERVLAPPLPTSSFQVQQVSRARKHGLNRKMNFSSWFPTNYRLSFIYRPILGCGSSSSPRPALCVCVCGLSCPALHSCVRVSNQQSATEVSRKKKDIVCATQRSRSPLVHSGAKKTETWKRKLESWRRCESDAGCGRWMRRRREQTRSHYLPTLARLVDDGTEMHVTVTVAVRYVGFTNLLPLLLSPCFWDIGSSASVLAWARGCGRWRWRCSCGLFSPRSERGCMTKIPAPTPVPVPGMQQ